LIASLREGSGASGESVGVSSLEYDSVKQERDMFKEELQQYKMTIDNMKMELLVKFKFTERILWEQNNGYVFKDANYKY
jgi:hypothetical protein